MGINFREEILKIIVCTQCKGQLSLYKKEHGEFLFCKGCGILFPIKHGIPIMIIEESIKLDEYNEPNEKDKYQ